MWTFSGVLMIINVTLKLTSLCLNLIISSSFLETFSIVYRNGPVTSHLKFLKMHFFACLACVCMCGAPQHQWRLQTTKHKFIKIIWLCLKIYNLQSLPHICWPGSVWGGACPILLSILSFWPEKYKTYAGNHGMSLNDDSRAIWVLVLWENQVSQWRSNDYPVFGLAFLAISWANLIGHVSHLGGAEGCSLVSSKWPYFGFLGGLNLHLYNLVAKRSVNFDLPFKTLHVGICSQIWIQVFLNVLFLSENLIHFSKLYSSFKYH